MKRLNGLLFGVAVAISSISACLAGPCSQQIDALQVRIDARLNAAAAAGPAGTESTAATMHHQPTAESIAAAEAKLGDISAKKAQEVGEAMKLARKADLAGDKAGCEKALAQAKNVMGY
jgi:hypothetical protein